MIGSNTSAQHPLAYARITAAKKRGAKLITVDPRRTPVATLSDIHLAIRPGSNLALVNALMHVILFEEKGQDDAFINERTEHFDALRASLEGCTPEWAAPLTGLQPEAIRETARLYAKGPNSIILYCMGVTQQVTGTRTCGALANLVMLCGMIGRPSTGLIPLRGQNNVQGSCDMGALPETLPGYVKADSELGHQRFARLWGPFADEQGKKLTEIMDGMRDGSIRAAYIMGENPMQSDPDAAKVEAGLRNLDLLIVQDIFMTPTARLADVILPAASYLEKQGTFTNTERRVQLINEVLPPLPGTRPDWRIQELAFDAMDTVKGCLALFTGMISSMTFKKDVMERSAKNGFTNATDAADYLVNHGVPFRDAHGIIGRLVLACIERGCSLDDLPLEAYKEICPVFEEDVYEAISMETCVKKRTTIGAPGQEAMKKVIAECRKRLEE